jgi:hypothetical protein
MDDDARAADVLTSSVLLQFASEFMGLCIVTDMWLTFVSVINHPRMLFICPWFRSMIFGKVTLLLISSTRRVLLSGASSTLFALLFVVPAHVVRLCALMWSFSASTSSCLGSARSLSPVVLRILAYVTLGCSMVLLCLLPIGLSSPAPSTPSRPSALPLLPTPQGQCQTHGQGG